MQCSQAIIIVMSIRMSELGLTQNKIVQKMDSRRQFFLRHPMGLKTGNTRLRFIIVHFSICILPAMMMFLDFI